MEIQRNTSAEGQMISIEIHKSTANDSVFLRVKTSLVRQLPYINFETPHGFLGGWPKNHVGPQGGEGGQNVQNSVHMVYGCPLDENH